jgi:hypothetical protein
VLSTGSRCAAAAAAVLLLLLLLLLSCRHDALEDELPVSQV